MDSKTGSIREVPEGEVARPGEIRLNKLPRKGCKHCYGRGYIGRDGRGEVVLCRCVNRR